MKKIKLPTSKHKLGYTEQELSEILNYYKIDRKVFDEKFGINTCSIDPETNEILYYRSDIERAIRLCIENRDMNSWEWD